MPSQRNIQEVADLKERFGKCTLIISTGFTGLPVSAMTELRRRLREKGLEYRVVKNTLASIAAQEVGRSALQSLLQGPTGLVLTTQDPAEAVKGFDEVVRTTRITLPVRGALLNGQVLTPADLTALASLPPKPVLMATLIGRVKGPLAALVWALQGPMQSLATVLQRAVEKQEGTPSSAPAQG
ncbi:50S ribosomal protein L10 [bacterium HR23]|nr:50S ribosomal protein L10 [bacterium HR23]